MERTGLTINVNKRELMETLEANRRGHGAAYRKAKAGYIKVTTRQLNEYVELLANGELLVQRFINAPPEDHTSDYNDAIAMMKWSLDQSIELTQGQLKQYVLDDWGWKETWVTSNTQYREA